MLYVSVDQAEQPVPAVSAAVVGAEARQVGRGGTRTRRSGPCRGGAQGGHGPGGGIYLFMYFSELKNGGNRS